MAHFQRLLNLDPNGRHSAFLFGPRGTGKTSWIHHQLSDYLYIDLLDTQELTYFLADPSRLATRIPQSYSKWVVIDEVQKIPELLNEVHRLIESRGYRFLLTGSSARSLKRKGVNLLAGRAFQYTMHPMTAHELGQHFSLSHALSYGLLPYLYAYPDEDPQHYLQSYIATYLQEEVQQEGLVRELGSFARFL